MRYALISDIHANLDALEACVDEIDRAGIDVIACLGDTVGYGAEPNECLDLVRRRADHVVIGNHDAAIIDKTEADYFNGDARAAVDWTREILTEENRNYLLTMPFTQVLGDDILLVHSGPAEPHAWDYVFHQVDAEREFTAFEQQICFIGHTHFPVFFLLQGGKVHQLPPPSCAIATGERAIINVGSVGQPRDGDQRAAFCIYDSTEGALEIRRVEYDVSRVQDRILATSLPSSAASRLAWGV